MVRITSTTFDEDGIARRTVTDHPGKALVLDHDDHDAPIKLVPEDGGDFPCCAPTPAQHDAYTAGYSWGARDARTGAGFRLANHDRSSSEGYSSGYYDGYDGRPPRRGEVRTYRVIWEVDVDAYDPLSAARQALAMQRRPGSIATVFDVVDAEGTRHRVDLNEDAEAGPFEQADR